MSTTNSLRLPTAPKHFGETRWFYKLLPIACFLVANIVVTQEVARKLGHQAALGSPIFLGFYAPWAWIAWAAKFWFRHPELGSIFKSAGLQVILGVVAGIVVSRLLTSRDTKKSLSGAEDLHGSSRWATKKEIVDMGLTGNSGLYIGAYESTPTHLAYLRYPGDEHVFAFWPSRSGKSAGLVIPWLLSNTSDSVIVLDPKGELHKLTSGFRSEVSEVYNFAPLSPEGTRFNVFAEVRIGTICDVGDAQKIAQMHCIIPGQESKDPHWDQMAAQLVRAVILHEGYKAYHEGKTINGQKVLNALTAPHLPRRFAEMSHYEHDPRKLMGWVDADGNPTATHPAVRNMAQTMLNLCRTVVSEDGEERLELDREGSGYVTNASKRFELYEDPRIARATAASDFRIEDLINGSRPATLYLHFPLSDPQLRPMVRVFFNVLFSRLTEDERIKQPNRFKLRMLLEEFATLGYMDIFDERIADAAGYGIHFTLIAQNVEQIYKHYTRYQSIISNCGVQICAAPNDMATAAQISSMTGTHTLQHLSASFSGDAKGTHQKSMSTHVNYVKRELLTPDEVRRLEPPKKEGDKVVSPGALLIFLRGQYPIYGRQMFYFLDREFVRRSQAPEVIHETYSRRS